MSPARACREKSQVDVGTARLLDYSSTPLHSLPLHSTTLRRASISLARACRAKLLHYYTATQLHCSNTVLNYCNSQRASDASGANRASIRASTSTTRPSAIAAT